MLATDTSVTQPKTVDKIEPPLRPALPATESNPGPSRATLLGYQQLLDEHKEVLTQTVARPELPAPTKYSTLLLRVLLASAMGLILLSVSRPPNDPIPEPATPEISTGEVQINPAAGTSVDDPPPNVLVQPSE